jgi:hypothetical protein
LAIALLLCTTDEGEDDVGDIAGQQPDAGYPMERPTAKQEGHDGRGDQQQRRVDPGHLPVYP